MTWKYKSIGTTKWRGRVWRKDFTDKWSVTAERHCKTKEQAERFCEKFVDDKLCAVAVEEVTVLAEGRWIKS